jgi:hypothetical protein
VWYSQKSQKTGSYRGKCRLYVSNTEDAEKVSMSASVTCKWRSGWTVLFSIHHHVRVGHPRATMACNGVEEVVCGRHGGRVEVGCNSVSCTSVLKSPRHLGQIYKKDDLGVCQRHPPASAYHPLNSTQHYTSPQSDPI